MRILFAGSPQLAVPALESVYTCQQICAILTNPDRPAGRHGLPVPTPVKAKAMELGLPVLQPERLDTAFIKTVSALKCELLVVVAFGKIFPKEFLDLFPLGGINLHPSLLPRFRGPSPIPAAILSGDRETGVTIQKLGLKMDSGDILRVQRVLLSGSETTGSLSEQLGRVGADLLAVTLQDIAAGRGQEAAQQEEEATYCRLVRKENGRIEWKKDAAFIERMIRAYDPWPGAFTSYQGLALNILAGGVCPDATLGGKAREGLVLGIDSRYGILVATGQGTLYVTRLQLQSKKAMDWRAFLNGHRDFAGSLLGEMHD